MQVCKNPRRQEYLLEEIAAHRARLNIQAPPMHPQLGFALTVIRQHFIDLIPKRIGVIGAKYMLVK
jgi:hypothetical protein